MSVIKVILLGNVGGEPKVKTLQDGSACAMFSVATTEKAYKTSSGIQVPERTEWHNVVAWRGLASAVERFVHKGDKVYVEGKLKTRKYTDKNGIERVVVEIHAESMNFLGSQSAANSSPTAQRQSDYRTYANSEKTALSEKNETITIPSKMMDDNRYDEIPF